MNGETGERRYYVLKSKVLFTCDLLDVEDPLSSHQMWFASVLAGMFFKHPVIVPTLAMSWKCKWKRTQPMYMQMRMIVKHTQ